MNPEQINAKMGGEPVRKEPFPTNALGVSLYGDEELLELADVIREKSPFRHYGLGNPRKVRDFENEVRQHFGCRYALALSSGTAALFCAIIALGVGPGDEVILPAFGWFSDYYSVTNSGALPVFADIDENLNLDPVDLKKKITPRTKAVIVIHFQGCPAKMDEILEVTQPLGIKVIEDIAQSFGGSYKDQLLGTMGDIAVASFQQNKVISSGEGGLFFTNQEKYFVRAVRYSDLGLVREEFLDQLTDKSLAEPASTFAGMQLRMSELQGAVLLAQFRKLGRILDTCRKYHSEIREQFKLNEHFRIRFIEGDCGITLFLQFASKEKAMRFSKSLEVERVRLGATSACKNLVPVYPIKSRKLANDALPPFGKGFEGENIHYDPSTCCPNTDGIAERYVATGLGPQFKGEDIADLIRIIERADRELSWE